MSEDLDTSEISNWRSIVTLIVFVLTNIIVLLPFHVPVYVPKQLGDAILNALHDLRVMPLKQDPSHHSSRDNQDSRLKLFVRFNFPMNFITAPLLADLFLLAISAIGRQDVYDGTIGADNLSPYDIIIVFLCLGYIAGSIEASGLIRYLAFHMVCKAGRVGQRLFFYLYTGFFGLGIFIGNDPIMVAFLSYMTRVTSNISHPRAWIHTQFAIANIATAILVSSNPTNLVLAGAFNIKFINYTANIIVPVISTAIALFPFLLYIVFADLSLIPLRIEMHELVSEPQDQQPVNPNIPNGRADEGDRGEEDALFKLTLQEIMRPFLEKGSATLGTIVMVITIIILLALNAIYLSSGGHPDCWVTLPAAFVMFSWDLASGWCHRHQTREIARKGREEIELFRAEGARTKEIAERARREEEEEKKKELQRRIVPEDQHGICSSTQTCSTAAQLQSQSRSGSDINNITHTNNIASVPNSANASSPSARNQPNLTLVPEDRDSQIPVTNHRVEPSVAMSTQRDDQLQNDRPLAEDTVKLVEGRYILDVSDCHNAALPKLTDQAASSEPEAKPVFSHTDSSCPLDGRLDIKSIREDDESRGISELILNEVPPMHGRQSLMSLLVDAYRWWQETFPTTTAVLGHLPYSLVPFALSMFVLVQALVNNGWVPLFAHGWIQWVNRTGTIGSIAGMGLISVILCNFGGTNIGASIFLSQVILAWQDIQQKNEIIISDRTFWGTVYSMALGVNYGAFSMAFSASLAGIMWRDVLDKKHICVRRLEFARVNLPIIAFAMTIGCAVLVVEMYIIRDNSPYSS